jgi:cytochrome P450
MSAVPPAIADLPAPPGLPLLGNLHQTWRIDRAHLVVEGWADRYGPIFKFHVGRRLTVVVSDVDEINRVLRERPEGYRRWREIETGFQEMGFPGVFSVEGDAWRRQRRLVVTALNSNHLHRHFHVIRTATERLHRRLQAAARDGRSIDLTQALTSYAVDVTSTLAFGHDLNTLERGENELQRHIQQVFNVLNFRIFFPIPYWRWFRLPPDRRLERSLVKLNRAVTAFIEQARERMRECPELFEAPENFLEAMLAAQRDDGTFTDEEIVGNTFTLLIAGEDTTAHTMAWTSWFLAQHADIQARWAQEALEVLGDDLLPTDHELVSRFVYGEAVLRESMRLKSVANGVTVEPLIDTTICDTQIPAGTRLILETRYAGRSANGAEYDPERWLDDGERQTPDQKTFLAFGAGPRFCPGRNLAFLEAKTAMAMIARNFELELDSTGGPVTERFTFTTIPKGLRVRLRERVTGKPIAVGATEQLIAAGAVERPMAMGAREHGNGGASRP